MTQPSQAHSTAVNSEDMAFLGQFEAAAIPGDAFGHKEHVRVAWVYLRLYDLTGASHRFIDALKRFADFHGADGLYHETITWAFLLAINERIGKMARHHDWQAFAAENPDMLESGSTFLHRYYRPETLKSDLARRVFVLPDRGLAPVAP
jgi:hypothetical protein